MSVTDQLFVPVQLNLPPVEQRAGNVNRLVGGHHQILKAADCRAASVAGIGKVRRTEPADIADFQSLKVKLIFGFVQKRPAAGNSDPRVAVGI